MQNDEYLAPAIERETCFVPATHHGKGRRTALAPGASAARFLHYGRITLDANDAAVAFENGDHETGLICLKGECAISVGADAFDLRQYDALYVPRGETIEVTNHGRPVARLTPVPAVADDDLYAALVDDGVVIPAQRDLSSPVVPRPASHGHRALGDVLAEMRDEDDR